MPGMFPPTLKTVSVVSALIISSQLIEVNNRLQGRAQLKTGEREKETLARMAGAGNVFTEDTESGLPSVSATKPVNEALHAL